MQEKKSPWMWIPSLYMAEGLPNVIVTSVAVVLYMQMGLTDTEIGLYTGWLGLPWIIKPFWSPFVDLCKTKRWWVLAMQLLLGSSLAGIAFTLNTDFWFQGTMFCFFLMAFASATHDIAADGYYMLELDEHQQSWFVGIRNTFYRLAVIFGNGALVPLAGYLQTIYPDRHAFVWSLVFYGVAALFIAFWLWHCYLMPKAAADVRNHVTAAEVTRGLVEMFKVFFTRMPWRELLCAVIFIMFYRFPEALLNAMSKTFLTRSQEDGGLGLSLAEYGISYGTVGLIGLLLGGIVGGWAVSKWGLKKCLWPLVLCITLPDIVYVYLSYVPTDNLWLIGSCVCIEQIGYGLGFAAYTLFLVTFSRGERSTAVFSICTAGQYLGGVMLPGMVSGLISENIGYQNFFWLVMAFCLVTFTVTACVKIEQEQKS